MSINNTTTVSYVTVVNVCRQNLYLITQQFKNTFPWTGGFEDVKNRLIDDNEWCSCNIFFFTKIYKATKVHNAL